LFFDIPCFVPFLCVGARANAACDSEAAAAALRKSLETSAADRARRSRAVAVLVPPAMPSGATSKARPSPAQQQQQQPGRVVVLWASAPNAWQNDSDGSAGVSAVLEEVLASFEANPAL
jgi:hypothetical protein